MKRNVKGFTLVECIVAMALIAIASLFMAQIYGSLSMIERGNKALSTSLFEQMEIAEKELTKNDTNTDVTIIKIQSGGSSGTDPIKFKIDTTKGMGSQFKITENTSDIDLYVLKPSGDTATDSDGRKYKVDKDVRYKFILPKGSE